MGFSFEFTVEMSLLLVLIVSLGGTISSYFLKNNIIKHLLAISVMCKLCECAYLFF